MLPTRSVLLLVFCLVGACTAGGESRDVCLQLDGFDDEQAADVRAGVTQWSAIGFVFDQPTCDRDLVIAATDTLDNAGRRSGDYVEIQSVQRGETLRLIATHEAGHALIPTHDHAPRGAVMAASNEGVDGWQLTDVDIAFALERR